MQTESSADPLAYTPLLSTVRRRRYFFLGLVLIYLPAMAVTLRLTQSFGATMIAFAIWVVLLCVAVVLMACSKCPACGNNFHMRGSTLSFSGTCRHCGVGAASFRSGPPSPC